MEFLLALYPNEIVPISACLQLCTAQLPHGAEAPKRLVCPPSATGALRGKQGQGDLMDEGTLLPGKCLGVSPSYLCGGKLEGHLNL